MLVVPDCSRKLRVDLVKLCIAENLSTARSIYLDLFQTEGLCKFEKNSSNQDCRKLRSSIAKLQGLNQSKEIYRNGKGCSFVRVVEKPPIYIQLAHESAQQTAERIAKAKGELNQLTIELARLGVEALPPDEPFTFTFSNGGGAISTRMVRDIDAAELDSYFKEAPLAIPKMKRLIQLHQEINPQVVLKNYDGTLSDRP